MERAMRQYRCLVVEDSKTMRDMLAESLNRIPGMVVIEAENGLAGIRALATERFDLVVTDTAEEADLVVIAGSRGDVMTLADYAEKLRDPATRSVPACAPTPTPPC